MRRIQIILLTIGILMIAIQFTRPARNQNKQVLLTDISKSVTIPDSVQSILTNACYDCHSNNTNYPWYVNIQPTGWLMAKHINQGKEELNFSEFGNYSPRRQISKLNGIANSIEDDIMPLPSYRFMHKNARLSENEKSLVIRWIQNTEDSQALDKNQ
jgi:hypothetical protein